MATGMDDTRRVKIGEPATYVYCAVRAGRRPTPKRGVRGLPATEPPRVLDIGEQLWLVVATAAVAQYGAGPIERGGPTLLRRLDVAGELLRNDRARQHGVRDLFAAALAKRTEIHRQHVDTGIRENGI